MPPAEAGARTTGPAARYRVLLDIGRTLTGTLSPRELHRAIYRETARVLEAAGFYISLYDAARDLATIVFYADRGEERQVEVTYRGSDSEVVRTGRGSLIEDRAALRSLLVLGDESGGVTRAAISAPLLHNGDVLGVISTQSYAPHAYDSADLELLQGIADIAVVAIENARFVAELDRRRDEAERIEEIGRALAGSLDPEEVLGKIIDAVLALVEAESAAVWLVEGERVGVRATGGLGRIPEGTEWAVEGPLFERLVREGRPVVIDDLEESPLLPAAMRELLPGGSGLAVPLLVAGDVAGVLSAGSSAAAAFRDDDLRVLERLASQAAVALENARLHAHVQALSLTDALTSLPNRRHLQVHLEHELAAARRGRDVILCLFDLDNFKGYNDAAGHLAGDEALRAFGRILADENRAMNLVARYGGDEFVSVLSETTPEGARRHVRRVQRRVGDDPLLAPAGITVSCGVSSFDPAVMRGPDDLLRAADADLCRRKEER